jgi:hypothetical protein
MRTASAGRTCVKFDTWDFYGNLSGKTNLVKIRKKYRARFIVSGDLNRHKSGKSDIASGF